MSSWTPRNLGLMVCAFGMMALGAVAFLRPAWFDSLSGAVIVMLAWSTLKDREMWDQQPLAAAVFCAEPGPTVIHQHFGSAEATEAVKEALRQAVATGAGVL